jgi:hypothetical protein
VLRARLFRFGKKRMMGFADIMQKKEKKKDK